MKTIIFGILLIIYTSFVSLENQRFTLERNFTNCTSPGLACRNCQEVILCLENSNNGTFTEYLVETCTNNYTSCSNGQCTSRPNPDCSSNTTIDFICRTPGMYPDPIDCKKYHYCVPEATINSSSTTVLNKYTAVCECDYAYNALTNFCDRKLGNGTCDGYSMVSCRQLGQTQALEDNPSLYYICLAHPNDSAVLYPFLYACEHGKIYNSEE